jgi:hypothetical protein
MEWDSPQDTGFTALPYKFNFRFRSLVYHLINEYPRKDLLRVLKETLKVLKTKKLPLKIGKSGRLFRPITWLPLRD